MSSICSVVVLSHLPRSLRLKLGLCRCRAYHERGEGEIQAQPAVADPEQDGETVDDQAAWKVPIRSACVPALVLVRPM